MYKSVVIACATLLLSSCVSLPKCSQVMSGEDMSSRIIVYRKGALLGMAGTQNISLNQCHMGTLWNAGYLVQAVPPGRHYVNVLDDFGKPVSAFPLDVEANKDYYLKWSFKIEDVYLVGAYGGTTGKHQFRVVEKDFAISELEKLNKL